MPPMRWLIISFWIFIVVALGYQFFTYNADLNKEVNAQPVQKYVFYDTNVLNPKAPDKPAHDGADVKQISYTVLPDTPSNGMLTAQLVVKNVGNAKALGVQILVRPYRGTRRGDEDNGHGSTYPVLETDPISQIGQWVSAGDLAPGETMARSAVFVSQSGLDPGVNPDPQIIFQSEKPKATP